MKQKIQFLRGSSAYASKEAAIAAIGNNSVTHYAGQPVCAFYTYTPSGGTAETRVVLAIGTGNGTYDIIASNAEVSQLTSLLAAHVAQVAGANLGHVKTGGDLTFDSEGVGVLSDIPASTILGNKTNAAGHPEPLTTTEVKAMLGNPEPNQNAFSNVKVGTATIAADAKQDTLELAAGNQITLSADTTNDKVTINLETNPYLGAATADTADTGTNTTQVATTAFVQTEIANKIAAADAMIYKGTLGTTADGGTVQQLPYSTAKTGWTYKVVTAGSYTIAQGKTAVCEVGDMVICLTSGTSSTGATWTVVQNNIDGAVTGPASSTDGNLATFDGRTGKVIKDATIAASDVVSLLTGAVRTTRNINTTGVLEGGGNLAADRTISHKTLTDEYSEGSGSFITSLTVDDYGHVSAATKGGITASNSGSGSFVTGVTASGNTITVTKGNVPAESGKVKVDASDGAGYLANKVVTGTANLTGNNNTYAVTAATAGSGTSKTVALTCTIDTIDGGEF